MRASGGVEKVELIELASLLQAFLCDVVVTKRGGSLSQSDKVFIFFQLLGSFEGNLDVATRESKVESLLGVLFKEQGDFTVTLLLQISDERSSTELAFTQDFLYFL